MSRSNWWYAFQCSSASRKFLNRKTPASRAPNFCRFSALQRAENSSISRRDQNDEVLQQVSVLFSEPKIPQYAALVYEYAAALQFQCSSASRKFLNILVRSGRRFSVFLFQCSSASRKFLNTNVWLLRLGRAGVSVLFSEPKIPQCYNENL